MQAALEANTTSLMENDDGEQGSFVTCPEDVPEGASSLPSAPFASNLDEIVI